MKSVKKILIVCTGNSCRSVMAESYLKKRLKEIGVEEVRVESAGTGTISGLNPTKDAVKVMEETGIDVSKYQSTPLDKNLIMSADVILVMEPVHKDRISEMVQEASNKTYLLRKFAASAEHDFAIPDPIGRHADFYKIVFNMIKEAIEGFIIWLKE